MRTSRLRETRRNRAKGRAMPTDFESSKVFMGFSCDFSSKGTVGAVGTCRSRLISIVRYVKSEDQRRCMQ